MSYPRDFWVLREPAISKQEWHGFLESHPELHQPSEVFGVTPEGQSVRPKLTEFVWWHGSSSGLPTPVAYTASGIHIAAGDLEAASFANVLADYFGGFVQEG
jgi:hypothetical protein